MLIVEKRGRERPPHPDILTPAEWRVLAGLRAGETNAVIAATECVSIHTVRSQVSSILGKLGAAHRRDFKTMEAAMTDETKGLRCSFCMRTEHRTRRRRADRRSGERAHLQPLRRRPQRHHRRQPLRILTIASRRPPG